MDHRSATPPSDYDLRPVERLEEFHACEAVAKLVWQVDDRELVPASHLKALAHGGGLVVGAFEGGSLVGFSVGFLARHRPDEAIGFHSHLMGVLPEHRRAGVALRIKRFQRAWCLERGLTWVTWTFDPLQARSARMNLERLGAVGERYERDYYGTLGGVRFGGLPTDRLWVRWTLDDPRVARLLGEAAPVSTDEHPARADREAAGAGVPLLEADLPWALAHGPGGAPGRAVLDRSDPAVRVASPAALEPLLYEAPGVAMAWRMAVRDAMEAYMSRGYRAVRFLGDAFVLQREGAEAEEETCG